MRVLFLFVILLFFFHSVAYAQNVTISKLATPSASLTSEDFSSILSSTTGRLLEIQRILTNLSDRIGSRVNKMQLTSLQEGILTPQVQTLTNQLSLVTGDIQNISTQSSSIYSKTDPEFPSLKNKMLFVYHTLVKIHELEKRLISEMRKISNQSASPSAGFRVNPSAILRTGPAEN